MTQATLTQLFYSPPLWLALVFALAFAAAAWGIRLLTFSGAVSTAIIGFIVFGLGGGKFLVPLLTFFLTSSLLSRLGKARKANANAQDAKSATRDAAQVWANGAIAVLMVLLFAYFVRIWPAYKTRLFLMLFLAALATVNADTWATEIGKLSRRSPRLLSNWSQVAPGTSGAISGLGLFAGMLGSMLIPLVSYRLWNLQIAEFVAVAWAGFLGCFIDSLIGASVQAKFRDPVTGEITERTEIRGRRTHHFRGIRWLNNDWVNLLAGAGGALCAWILLNWAVYPYFQ
jgi:uncharacterized protein (TIGR00297 family)